MFEIHIPKFGSLTMNIIEVTGTQRSNDWALA